MTVNSRPIQTYLAWSPGASEVPLPNGLRVQVLPSINELPRARKHQFAAFLAAEALLVVWDDEAMNIVERARKIETDLMQLVWEKGESSGENEKDLTADATSIDEESGVPKPEFRATHLQNSVLVGFTCCLVTIMLGAGWRQIAVEYLIDFNVLRFLFLLLIPLQVFFTMVRHQIYK
jgi:hypothetical protein